MKTRRWTSMSPSQAASFLQSADEALGRASQGSRRAGHSVCLNHTAWTPDFCQGGSTSSECLVPEATPTSNLYTCVPGRTPLQSQKCRLIYGLDLTLGKVQTRALCTGVLCEPGLTTHGGTTPSSSYTIPASVWGSATQQHGPRRTAHLHALLPCQGANM